MDLDAVRTFVAVADAGQFQHAAADLSITQQAVSKRIAALEKDLGVRLFRRTPRGARLTVDGQAFLPHARDLLRVEERAAAHVGAGSSHIGAGSRVGTGPLQDAFADSPALATFVGEQTQLRRLADHGLRRIALRGPTPVYPQWLIWRSDNPHPALARLRDHLGSTRPGGDTWTPKWADPAGEWP